ncbi:hypothetical protein H0H87_007447, partial [Tephrocybe sp. NHM501043]
MAPTVPLAYGTNLEESKPDAKDIIYQAQLGFKATRKHFFAPIDSAYADAVHRDAETVEYTDKEE